MKKALFDKSEPYLNLKKAVDGETCNDAPKSFPKKDVNVARSIMVEFDQLIKAYGTVIDALEIEVGEVRDVGVTLI